MGSAVAGAAWNAVTELFSRLGAAVRWRIAGTLLHRLEYSTSCVSTILGMSSQ